MCNHVFCIYLFQNPSHMVNRGPQHCPRFATHPGRDRLLLPNGVPSEIRLEVINLPQAVRSYGGGLLFHCLVTIEGAKMRVPARVEGNRFVICERTTVRYLIHLKSISDLFLRRCSFWKVECYVE